MQIFDLVHFCDINDVLNKISLHYGDGEIRKFEELYNNLLNMSLSSAKEKTTIYINAYEESEEEDILLETFNEDDTSIIFDVSAFVDGDEMVYSIASSSYSDFLSCFIDVDTLNKYSKESILAHCLYEITAYSFDDNI